MRLKANISVFLLLITCSSPCWSNDSKIVATTGKTLEVKASIIPQFLQFNSSKSKVEGQITIINITSSSQKYSNEFLILKVNGSLDSRTYKNVIYSDFIDFGLVEIKPQASLSFPVYWVFNASTNAKVDSVQLFLDEEGVEKKRRSAIAAALVVSKSTARPIYLTTIPTDCSKVGEQLQKILTPNDFKVSPYEAYLRAIKASSIIKPCASKLEQVIYIDEKYYYFTNSILIGKHSFSDKFVKVNGSTGESVSDF